MKRTDCDSCSALREIVAIRSPDELTHAIRVIRSNLDDAILQDITQPAHSPSGSFLDLPDAAPWPDYVEYYFKCMSCGKRFRLAVDTYNGAGGEWDGVLEVY